MLWNADEIEPNVGRVTRSFGQKWLGYLGLPTVYFGVSPNLSLYVDGDIFQPPTPGMTDSNIFHGTNELRDCNSPRLLNVPKVEAEILPAELVVLGPEARLDDRASCMSVDRNPSQCFLSSHGRQGFSGFQAYCGRRSSKIDDSSPTWPSFAL